jgi:hypothetical protein
MLGNIQRNQAHQMQQQQLDYHLEHILLDFSHQQIQL